VFVGSVEVGWRRECVSRGARLRTVEAGNCGLSEISLLHPQRPSGRPGQAQKKHVHVSRTRTVDRIEGCDRLDPATCRCNDQYPKVTSCTRVTSSILASWNLAEAPSRVEVQQCNVGVGLFELGPHGNATVVTRVLVKAQWGTVNQKRVHGSTVLDVRRFVRKTTGGETCPEVEFSGNNDQSQGQSSSRLGVAQVDDMLCSV
jgi:hypothetical protein